MFSILQRGGNVYSRHVERVTVDNLTDVIKSVCAADAHLITDTGVLKGRNTGLKQHSLANQTADEYVRYEEGFCVTTNTVEGYFSILKRGINAVYHQVGASICIGICRSLISDTTIGNRLIRIVRLKR